MTVQALLEKLNTIEDKNTPIIVLQKRYGTADYLDAEGVSVLGTEAIENWGQLGKDGLVLLTI